MCVSKDVSKVKHRIPERWNPTWFKYCKQYDQLSLAVPLDSLFHVIPGLWVLSWLLGPHSGGGVTGEKLRLFTPVSWSSWLKKAAQPSGTFWAMEGYCREPQNTELDVTEQNQQIGNVLTTKLCVEGQVMRVNYSPKHTLLSLHWLSSVWFY